MTGAAIVAGLLGRELALALRDRGLRVALLGSLAVLLTAAGLLVVGLLAESGGRVDGDRLTAGALGLLAGLWAVVAPWMLSRLACRLERDELVREIALAARPPWQVVTARLMTAWACLAQLVAVSLPVAALAYSVGGSGRALAAGIADLGLLLWILAIGIAHLGPGGNRRLVHLSLAYLLLAAVWGAHRLLLTTAGPAGARLALIAAGAGLVLLLGLRSRSRLLYLDD